MHAQEQAISIVPSTEPQNYEVIVGHTGGAALARHLEVRRFSAVFAVVDQRVDSYWRSISSHLTVPFETLVWDGGERCKSIEGLKTLWNAFLDNELDRMSCVISVGGGAQGDLVGFACATYKRGIPVVQVPTTLLSQVDASIGGKTAINFGEVKNLVGVIHHPSLVLVDSRSLDTLPERSIRSGMAEVIKHGLIRSSSYFERWSRTNFSALSDNEKVELIAGSLRIKAAIAAADPYERGERKLLNFGHTVGHAIEALSLEGADPLTHGEAIALGMLVESRISHLMGLLDPSCLPPIEEAMVSQGVPRVLPFRAHIESILEKIADDKKNVGREVRWTLLSSIGYAVYDRVVPEDLVCEALRQIVE